MSDASSSTHQVFWRQFRENYITVGALLPSSRFLARAMTARLAEKHGPVRVLEAGAGTGAFTSQILALLQPGDEFDAVEINPQFFAVLQQRFTPPHSSPSPGVEVHWINDDIRNLEPGAGYDFIIFSLPLTNFPPALVQEFLGQMVAFLKPGGYFSYFKYIFIGRFRYAFGGKAIRSEMNANHAIITGFSDRYQTGQTSVLRNLTPAWVYYWQKPGQSESRSPGG